MKNSKKGWNLSNTYLNLPKIFHSRLELKPVESPELVVLNEKLREDLGFDVKELTSIN